MSAGGMLRRLDTQSFPAKTASGMYILLAGLVGFLTFLPAQRAQAAVSEVSSCCKASVIATLEGTEYLQR